jgi:dephospho-CoA kinase
MQRDGITREKALQWIDRQWPQQQVKALADYEIVNDGIADIDSQIDRLLLQMGQKV